MNCYRLNIKYMFNNMNNLIIILNYYDSYDYELMYILYFCNYNHKVMTHSYRTDIIVNRFGFEILLNETIRNYGTKLFFIFKQ